MTEARALLSQLAQRDIKLWAEDGRLRFNAPKGALTPELKERIRQFKPTLLAILEKEDGPPAGGMPRGDAMPLSFAQQRLWFLDQLGEAQSVYNIPIAVRIKGELREDLLTRAFTEMVGRHESLRTIFTTKDGQANQVILDPGPHELHLIDLRDKAIAARESSAQQLVAEEAADGFDLATGPLFRTSLIRLDQHHALLLITMHHIISDGWSMSVLTKELFTLYQAFASGQPSPLQPLPFQYADFAGRQRAWLEAGELQRQLDYWKTHLAGIPDRINLPTDRPHPAKQTFNGDRIGFTLDTQTAAALKTMGQQAGTTPFMTWLALFNVFLYRYTGQEDILTGSPIANRPQHELEQLIGFFVNTLVLRVDLSPASGHLSPSFLDMLDRVRQTALDAFSHQDVPFEKMVEEIQPERHLSHSPLFQVMFIFQNLPAGNIALPGLEVTTLTRDSDTSKFELTLSLTEADGQLQGTIEYNTDLFDASTIRRMTTHFCNLAAGVAADPRKPIHRLPLLAHEERTQLLTGWDTASQPTFASLSHRFAQWAVKKSDHVAVDVGETGRLSYGQLDRWARAVAHQLKSHGVRSGDHVGLCTRRTPAMVAAMLGILQTGASYVSLDPNYPAERLAIMLEDTGCRTLLTHSEDAAVVSDFTGELILLDDTPPAAEPPPFTPPATTPESCAYVLFTSGSTGRPKGVVITHRGVDQLVHWAQATYSDAERDGVLAATSINFDLSVFEILVTLALGGRIVLADDALALTEWSNPPKMSLINTVPSAMTELAARDAIPPSVRTVNLAGEPLPGSLVKALYALPHIERVYNLYGPSEDTTYSTAFLCPKDAEREPVIGRPLAHTHAYVRDRFGELCPIGVPGELVLGGEGLARGYHNRAAQTAASFIPDPYTNRPGARCYRTGDLVRRLADGHLDFISRIDRQVKLRGFRIELSEIEAALLHHSDVQEAAVLVRERIHGDGNPQLFAFTQTDAGDQTLRDHLARHLPEYMIPSIFIHLDALPLTPNGKIDRRALQHHSIGETQGAETFVPPKTPLEIQLADIWRELLGRETIGLQDHFFRLGGHSLLATRMVSRIEAHTGFRIPLRAVFETPTLAQLARVVQDSAADGAIGLMKPLPRPARIPLSFAQERLWFLDQLDPGGTVYNMPVALNLKGELQIPVLQQVLDALVARHESLRTTFAKTEDQAQQIIQEPGPASLTCHDLTATPPAERDQQAREQVQRLMQQPFDLARGPLFHVHLFTLEPRRHILLINMHHIISDGWSLRVLVSELLQLFRHAHDAQGVVALRPLPLQYADYAIWQRAWLEGGELQRQLAYWKTHLADAPDRLTLPTDHPYPAVQSFRGAQIPFQINQDVTQKLRTLSEQHEATLFMTLLAAFKVMLSRYAGQTDILVGSPISGRNHAKIESLIGFFVNTLVLRSDLSAPDGRLRFRDLLTRVRRTTLDAYAHQDVPFEKLVEELQPERHLSYSPLFQVMMVLQNLGDREMPSLPGLDVTPYRGESHTAKFELSLSLTETQSGLSGNLEYNRDLFNQATARRMTAQFQTLLAGVVAQPDTPIHLLPLLAPDERDRLVHKWNDTYMDYDRSQCVLSYFDEHVQRHPDRLAALFGDGTQVMTFAQLNERADHLAAYLIKRGFGPEQTAMVCMERSLAMVVAILGIVKAGGVYVPVDTEFPESRIRVILQDSRAKFMMVATDAADAHAEAGVEVLTFDDQGVLAKPADPTATTVRRPVIHPKQRAYSIFTSGSTGRPKGVDVSHAALRDLVAWHRIQVTTAQDRRATLLTSPAFDIAVWDFWGCIGAGMTMCIPEPNTRLDPGELLEWIADTDVTHSVIPTPLAEACLRAPIPKNLSLLRMYTGGDRLTVRPPKEFKADFVNGYGPTECTVLVTRAVIESEPSDRPITIGKPLANAAIYITDTALQLVPIGVPGELLLAGERLARGYSGRPSMTAGVFIPNPFADTPGSRLYRTGDKVRYLPDGDVEFLGRIDFQIKIRGFRIEPGEIETVLRTHADIEDAVVQLVATPAGDRLAAWMTTPAGLLPEDLRPWLADHLPDYMTPAAFVALQSFPITTNGKIDRRALPTPDFTNTDAAKTPLTTPAQEMVAAIWSEILNLEDLGAEAHFFQLGGHSLRATQVVSRISAKAGVEIPLRKLFEKPVLADFAAAVDELAGAQDIATTARQTPELRGFVVPRDEPIPLSFAQQRLWFLDHLGEAQTAYNMPLAVRLNGDLRVDHLETAFAQIVARHESLRTTFQAHQGQAYQTVAPVTPTELPLTDLSPLAPELRDQQAKQLASSEARHRFDLAQGPLFRLRLVRLGADEHLLLFTMHHIISDGWSMGVFVRELSHFYRGLCSPEQASPLPELPLQYPDFAAWQRQWLAGQERERQLSFWRESLEDIPLLLDLPLDRPRPINPSYRGTALTADVDAQTTARLHEIGRQTGATLFMTLFSAFAGLLHRYSRQQDILIGTPVSGRNHMETEPLIGFFVNTLVLQARFHGDPSFTTLLERVRRRSLEAFAHQDLPFDQLVDALQPSRDLSVTPIFQVMFVLQNAPSQNLELPGLKTSVSGSDQVAAQFDIILTVTERPDGLGLSLVFRNDLFELETMTRFRDHFTHWLQRLCEQPDQPLSQLSYLGKAERAALLDQWASGTAPRHEPPCLHQLFETTCAHTPDALALITPGTEGAPDRTDTYGALNEGANQLARYLRSLDTTPSAPIAICLERGPDAMTAILAILKAGSPYLALDPELPLDRLTYMLRDSGAASVILAHATAHLADHLPTPVLNLDTAEITAFSRDNLAPPPTTALPAYLVYTSGSTGRPKGISIPHAAIAHHALSVKRAFDLESEDRILQFSALSFDVMAEEVFPTWAAGATLVSRPVQLFSTFSEFEAFITRHGISILNLPAGFWHEWVTDGPTAGELGRLRLIVTGSERVLPGKWHDWREATGIPVVNAYGPSETTVSAVMSAVDLDPAKVAHAVPIGRPVDHARTYVLDPRLQPVPMGVGGELCIGGYGLAHGYHGRPALTAASFVPDPYAPTPGARLYRTGDLARLLSDGDLDFLGRLDHQIKIRGFRIEPGEIEAVLTQHPEVRDALVLIDTATDQEPRLIAYVTGGERDESSSQTLVHTLIRHLESRLPAYMIPAGLIPLADFPLTPGGKVDRAKLPKPEDAEQTQATLAPTSETEATLVDIWGMLLDRPVEHTGTSFFALGGQSLLAVRLLSEIQRTFDVELSLTAFFQNPTIQQTAHLIETAQTTTHQDIVVPLNTATTGDPLFLIHPVGGQVTAYQTLAKHLDRPVFGIQAPELLDEPSPDTFEARARVYVEALRRIQGDGPYHLAGWSLGGVVALEMARLLLQDDANVHFLGLIDSFPPTWLQTRETKTLGDEEHLFRFVSDLAKMTRTPLPPVSTLRAMAGTLTIDQWIDRELPARFLPDADPRYIRRWWRAYRGMVGAEAQYVPATYAGEATLFRAATSHAHHGEAPDQIWRDHIGELHTVLVEGDHYTLLQEPGADALAASIQSALQTFGERMPGGRL